MQPQAPNGRSVDGPTANAGFGRVRAFFATHTVTKWSLIGILIVVLAIVLFAIFFDWNYFRPTLARYIQQKTGRATAINGDLRVHLWSWNPSAEVNGLTLANPAWAAHDVMFGAERLTVSVSLGRLLRGQLVIPEISVIRPTVDLERDAKERASWEFGSTEGKPQKPSSEPAKIPTIRRLIIEDGKLRVADAVKKLMLSGSLNAHDTSTKSSLDAGDREPTGFSLRCSGTLNSKPFQLRLDGGPLINLDPEHPYDLEAQLAAGDIRVDAHARFPKPFDLAAYTVKFEVSGNDLADVYYLTSLALPNTPPYRLTADLEHSGTVFRTTDLKGRLGTSDLSGTLQIDTGRTRPKLFAKLHSDKLDLVDLAPSLGHPVGAPSNTLDKPKTTASGSSAAAAVVSPPATPAVEPAAAPDRLFPDAQLQVNRVRGMDADVTYEAKSVLAPKMPMKAVDFHLTLQDGLLKLDPLAFVLDAGKFTGSVSIDARKNVPQSSIDMRVDDVDLGQFKSASAKEPPLQGSLVGRLKVHGKGGSVHELASTADGTLSVALPSGQMNQVFAELTGINVPKALGLLLSKNQTDTDIRCGVIDFQAQQGLLTARSVFIDTTQVLITGRGSVNLGDEKLDLSLQGDPKKIRLFRLRTPITLHGTLLHPSVGVKPQNLLAQAGVAVALGTLLTPFAAALAYIDPGLAKNKDCGAVIAEARADANDQAPPVPH